MFALSSHSSSGRFEVLHHLGSGGLGDVYAAWDRQTRRKVAIKRIKQNIDRTNPQLADSAAEAKALSALRHPNIVRLIDMAMDSEGLFFVLELIEGESLAQIVQREVFERESFISMASQALEGLGAAHRKGLLHLDIKPGNIMLQPRADGFFSVKLVDFGLANFVDKIAEQQAKAEEDDSIYGSIYYISPEQLQRGALDARCDLYSLGHVFYFTVTGQAPYHFCQDVNDLIYHHLEIPAEPLMGKRPDLGEPLCQWIEWFMQKDPAARPQSTQEALQVLTQIAVMEPELKNSLEESPDQTTSKTAAPPQSRGQWASFLETVGLFFKGKK